MGLLSGTKVQIIILVIWVQHRQMGTHSRVQHNLERLALGHARGVYLEARPMVQSQESGEAGGAETDGHRACRVVLTGTVGLQEVPLVAVVEPNHGSASGGGTVVDEKGVAVVDVNADDVQGDPALVGGRVDGERLVEVGPVMVAGPTIVVYKVIAALYRSLRTQVDRGLGRNDRNQEDEGGDNIDKLAAHYEKGAKI